MPYDDETKWGFEHVDVHREVVVNTVGTIMESLKPAAFSQMYKLKSPYILINSQFLDGFHVLSPNPARVIKLQYPDEEDFKQKPKKLYQTNHLMYVFLLLTTLLSRLYGDPNSMHFKDEWVPLVVEITELEKIFK